MPEIDKYYKVGNASQIPATEFDKDGKSKWWYQHLECEENVRQDKGPVFSQNPPGFIPD